MINKEVRDELEAIRRYRILEYARESGNVVAACRDLGIPRSSFYRWKGGFEMPRWGGCSWGLAVSTGGLVRYSLGTP